MSEAELNSYRFNSGDEPSDEMLAQIMHEVAVDAKKNAMMKLQRSTLRNCVVEQMNNKPNGLIA